MNKTFSVLYIYDLLLEGKHFQSSDLPCVLNCSLRTAKRYISAVKDYVEKNHEGKVVKYSARDKSYCLMDK